MEIETKTETETEIKSKLKLNPKSKSKSKPKPESKAKKTPADYQRAYRDRKRGGPPRALAECGTLAAAFRHRRHSEPVCEACAEAYRQYYRDRYAAEREGP